MRAGATALMLSVLVHAGIAWQLHRGPVPARVSAPSRAGTLVLLRLAAPPPAVERRIERPPARVKPKRGSKPVHRDGPTIVVAAPSASSAPTERIDGSVFALPRFGMPWGSSGSAAVAPPVAMPPVTPPDPAMRAMREQIILALEHQAAQWPTPADDRPARCALLDDARPQLQCDGDAIEAALLEHVAPLHGAFEAYRRVAVLAGTLVVAYDHGRYQVQIRHDVR